MGKSPGAQVTRTEPDRLTNDFNRTRYGAARAAGSQPYTPYLGQTVAGASSLSPEAVERTRLASNFGMMGMGAMAGDPTMVAQMMNPYNATLDPYWAQQRQMTLGAIGDQATRAGAFGGGRHGVAEGQALSDIANAQAMQRYGEFNSAMGRAGQLANFGMGANSQLFGMGDYFRNIQQQQLDDQLRRFEEARDWDVRNLNVLNSAVGGPSGQTTTTPMNRNAMGAALGGAATGSMFGPVGAGIGAAGGLLGWW